MGLSSLVSHGCFDDEPVMRFDEDTPTISGRTATSIVTFGTKTRRLTWFSTSSQIRCAPDSVVLLTSIHSQEPRGNRLRNWADSFNGGPAARLKAHAPTTADPPPQGARSAYYHALAL